MTEFVLTGPGTAPSALLRSVWRARGLIGVLARKDFLVRYRRTWLGLVWAIALPVVQALVLAVVFSSMVDDSARNGSSYAVFVFAGMVPWAFFSGAFAAGSTSVVDGSHLAQRIYFPRLVLPLVAVATTVFPLAATMLVLVAMIVLLGPGLSLAVLWLLPGAVLVVLLALGLSLLLSVAQVYVRDLRFAVTAGITVLFYATPVIYPIGRAPDSVRGLLELLPAAGPVELFRLAIGEAAPSIWRSVTATALWALVAGVAGFVLHCRRDRVMADLL